MDALLFQLATLFGVGKLPKAPGTWGSFVALVIAVPLLHYVEWPVFAGLIAAFFILGIAAADVYEKKKGPEDSPKIVIDELVGQWIAIFPLALPFLNVPFGDFRWATLLAFVLFRVLDIWKPWPIKWVGQNCKGGLGVMLDDVLAGLMTAGVLLLIGAYL